MSGEGALERLRTSVVGLVVSFQEHDADRPWGKRSPQTRYAQAAVVEGPFLLTTAQMVFGATLIEAEWEGRPPRATARVVHVDPEMNLALLTVDEPGWLDRLAPLAIAEAVRLPTDGPILAVRWNHQQFEAAEFHVKRVAVHESWFGRQRHAFLVGRTDLPHGGWAEPAVSGDALVGLASTQDEHATWVIPAEILAAYVARARRPEGYVPFPSVRFSWTWMTDRGLAAWLGLAEPRGVMIRHVPWDTTGHGALRARDVLLAIDGRPIDSRGYVQHPRYGSVEFTQVVVEGHRAGDVVPAEVWRQGQRCAVEVCLRHGPTHADLVPVRRGDHPPPYAIVGGLVFLELDGDYLRSWGNEWWHRAPIALLTALHRLETRQSPERRRIVVLTQVLPSSWSLGYQDCRDLIVDRIDGKAIGGIGDVADAFAAARGDEVRILFAANDQRSDLVVDRLEIAATTEGILRDYGIPAAVRLPSG